MEKLVAGHESTKRWLCWDLAHSSKTAPTYYCNRAHERYFVYCSLATHVNLLSYLWAVLYMQLQVHLWSYTAIHNRIQPVLLRCNYTQPHTTSATCTRMQLFTTTYNQCYYMHLHTTSATRTQVRVTSTQPYMTTCNRWQLVLWKGQLHKSIMLQVKTPCTQQYTISSCTHIHCTFTLLHVNPDDAHFMSLEPRLHI